MQRGTNPLSAGQAVVINQFTGAEFESGAVHRRASVNEPQPGVEPEPAGASGRGRWLARRAAELFGAYFLAMQYFLLHCRTWLRGIAAHPFAYVSMCARRGFIGSCGYIYYRMLEYGSYTVLPLPEDLCSDHFS